MSNMDRDAQLWLIDELYGIQSIPSTDDYEAFIKAALICAKGDGVLAPEERQWIVGRAAALRNPGYELAKTYAGDEPLSDVLAQSSVVNSNGLRMLIYVAIQACSADGEYHKSERTKIHQMAKQIGVSEEVVNQIEQFCAQESRLRQERIDLIFPDGVPY